MDLEAASYSREDLEMEKMGVVDKHRPYVPELMMNARTSWV